MKNLSVYLITAAIALSAVGCKDKDDNPVPATKTDLLTAKSWKVTDLKVNNISIFNSGLIDACVKDDLTKFNTNKTATFDEGTLKCNSTATQSRNGSWDFTTSETKLKVTDPDGDVVEGTIVTLNSTTLTLTDPNGAAPGVPAEVTYTAQ